MTITITISVINLFRQTPWTNVYGSYKNLIYGSYIGLIMGFKRTNIHQLRVTIKADGKPLRAHSTKLDFSYKFISILSELVYFLFT